MAYAFWKSIQQEILMSDPIILIVILLGVSLVPFFALMVTSYTKLAIVFALLRNALGVQQVPPNMVLNGMALVLSVYIMSPLCYTVFDKLKDKPVDKVTIQTALQLAGHVKEPLREFLLKHSRSTERSFFSKTIVKLWPERKEAYEEDELLVLIPAFTLSELTAAFEIGFLLYLPFIIVDLIIANILMAMGMAMVSPLTISIPFKLLLFVLLNGWQKIIHGLILSYI